MSGGETPVNLVGLMTAFTFELKALPDDLKCTKCESVLKNACQMPCGCRFCRACIDDVISRGDQFCPGGSRECGATPLSTVQRDYMANKSISKLIAKCPYAGCSDECSLADMEGHFRVCPRHEVDCPFRELGCLQGRFFADQLNSHLQQESRSHSEILIATVANINRDMELLKLGNEPSKEEIQTLKLEMVQNDEQMKHLENENRSIKNLIKSINDEMKRITFETESTRDENKSIKDEIKLVKAENKSIKNLIKSISDENMSLKDDIKCIKSQNRFLNNEIESIQNVIKSTKGEVMPTFDDRVGIEASYLCEIQIFSAVQISAMQITKLKEILSEGSDLPMMMAFDEHTKHWSAKSNESYRQAILFKFILDLGQAGSISFIVKNDKFKLPLRLYHDFSKI